jgi:hypothetical protein
MGLQYTWQCDRCKKSHMGHPNDGLPNGWGHWKMKDEFVVLLCKECIREFEKWVHAKSL